MWKLAVSYNKLCAVVGVSFPEALCAIPGQDPAIACLFHLEKIGNFYVLRGENGEPESRDRSTSVGACLKAANVKGGWA